MKVRTSFVSNSSSSSYLVFIPDRFRITKKDISDEIKYNEYDYFTDVKPDITKIFQRCNDILQALNMSKKIEYEDDCNVSEYENHTYLNIFVGILKKNGLVMNDINQGPGNNKIYIICQENIEEIKEIMASYFERVE